MRFRDFFLAGLGLRFMRMAPAQLAAVTVVVGGNSFSCSNIFSAALFFEI
jgi:hypothetical protein